eukprot:11938778-Karenia_brevis.AAC.1
MDPTEAQLEDALVAGPTLIDNAGGEVDTPALTRAGVDDCESFLAPLYAEHGATGAAAAVLSIAQRAAGFPSDDGRIAAIREARWSKLNQPLLWAAASGDDGHP